MKVAKILLEIVEEEYVKFEANEVGSEARIKIDYALLTLKRTANRFLETTNLLKEREWEAIVSASHGIPDRIADKIRKS